MSEVAFLVGEKIVEIRYGLGVRIVFDAGDHVEPALYADLGHFTVTDPDGVAREVQERSPTVFRLHFDLSARRCRKRRPLTTLRWS